MANWKKVGKADGKGAALGGPGGLIIHVATGSPLTVGVIIAYVAVSAGLASANELWTQFENGDAYYFWDGFPGVRLIQWP